MRRLAMVACWIGLIVAGLAAQLPQTVVTCPAGQVPTPTVSGASLTVTCQSGQPPVTAPTILSFTAAPSSISPGGTSQLTWTLGGGPPDTIQIEPGGIKLSPATRTFPVLPAATTTYTLSVASAGGKAQASTSVMVNPPPTTNTAVLVNAVAHPSSGIITGASTLVEWTSTGGNPITIHVETPSGGVPTNAGTPIPAIAVTARGQRVDALNGLWRVVYNRGTKQETFRHVTITTTGPGGPVDPPPVDPPPTTGGIAGLAVTAAELGLPRPDACTAAAHDQYLVLDPDGWRYRTWHPQVDNSALGKGCVYGHEHGDDPATQTNANVKSWFTGKMGYAARRFGMDEPHHGYKVHVALDGERNDEGRENLNATTSMPHVGTDNPARFSVNHHSVEIADWHRNGTHHTYVNTRFDTGVRGNSVCEPRVTSPTKDGTILNSVSGCKVSSSYEIWGMVATILRANGNTLLVKIITPAIFDPITLFNRTNPGELVYSWDPRVDQYKQFPEQDWSGYRGCDRENYSQVGYHFSGSDTSEEYLLDVRTNTVVPAANAWTTRLIVGHANTGSQPPFSSDILQFKVRKGHCGQRGKLSLTN